MSDQWREGPVQPTRRQRLKPFEYLAFAGVAGGFTLLVVLLSVRDLGLGLIFGVIAFIVTLLVTATLMLAVQPRGRDSAGLDRTEASDS
ncbi:hypothetical protein OVA14_04230 [Agrococcus sp. SL85]|uniref:hypothetical protein n=1 Tax=Agrococcus sp. SL85 TaxID=2995141 RepID=UPI00226CC07D|nr:hypothetical protein [Agrococcus sp. SL85]WAC66978.1 hypothetical protein OVA14_04230 [Agrococcus sp. SL85]